MFVLPLAETAEKAKKPKKAHSFSALDPRPRGIRLMGRRVEVRRVRRITSLAPYARTLGARSTGYNTSSCALT